MPLGLALRPHLVDLAGVIALALVRIADDVVGGVDVLEALFCLGLAWIEVGMRVFGGLAVGFADVVLAGVGCNTQGLVGIGHASHVSNQLRRHCSLERERMPRHSDPLCLIRGPGFEHADAGPYDAVRGL